MADLRGQQIKDRFQSILTTSETTSNPTTGTLQNGKGTAITALTVSGTVTATKLVPTGNVTTGNGMYLPTTNTLALSTNGAERMRIDASGNFMVGTSTADIFVRFDERYATLAATETTHNIALNISSGATASRGAQIYMGTGSTRHFTIGANNDDSYIGTTSNKPLRLLTNDLERMRITSAGVVELAQGQIKFPATQVASADPNTLDDYEEGTFDFGIKFGTSSTGVAYEFREGAYTKIGNKVTVSGRLVLTSKGTSTGDARITGLPFVSAPSNTTLSPASLTTVGVSFVGMLQPYGGGVSMTEIDLTQSSEAGVNTALTNTNFTDTALMYISLTYFTS
jgi:hypothetical protein